MLKVRENFEPEHTMEEYKLKKIGKSFKNAGKTLEKGAKTVGKGIEKGAKTVGKGIEKGVGSIASGFGGFLGPLAAIPKALMEIPKALMKIPEAIFKLFDAIIGVFKFLGRVITNPGSLLEFFVRLLLVIAFLPFAILYEIPVGDLRAMELFLYPFVLAFFTYYNVVLYAFFAILICVFGLGFDVHVTRGHIYPIIYRLFLATENSPAAWYSVGGYHNANRNERMILAFRECDDNYLPDKAFGKLTCTRNLEGTPAFCPQANIYRVFKNLGLKTPTAPRNFYPGPEFIDMTASGRRRVTNKYKKMKLHFYKSCDAKMAPYDNVTKNICRNASFLPITNAKKRQLQALCYNTYCRNGRREQFCHRTTNIAMENQSPSTNIVDRTVFLSGSLTLVTIFTVWLATHAEKA